MYRSNEELVSENELLLLIAFILLVCFIFMVIRNMYNAYKKRAYRKKNNELKEYVVANEKAVTGYSKQLRDIEKLEKRLTEKHEKNLFLEKELKAIKRDSEQKISTLGQEINHQQRAFEKFADYKSVEANNTRLGAHFIKNVINQVYMDLESARANYKRCGEFIIKLENQKWAFLLLTP